MTGRRLILALLVALSISSLFIYLLSKRVVSAHVQPIVERDLAVAGPGAGLSGKIPEGMRAISLKSDEVVGVAGFPLPGTRSPGSEAATSVEGKPAPSDAATAKPQPYLFETLMGDKKVVNSF